MSYATVMLGGVPILPAGGAAGSGVPNQTYTREQGRTLLTLSRGRLYNMAHWSREVITLSAAGGLPHGLDGLDFDAVLELRCTHPKSVSGVLPTDRQFTLTSTPRPDVAPWGWALRDGVWLLVPATVSGDQVTIQAMPGAELYRAAWMPMFNVICTPPEESMDTSYGWQLTATESL
ncbi:hypothetical protein [Metapseudomonas otitidis]|uniref:hypothetical protein n=1 Tax=Metapseudomonas otitidis TaxID=319939 RepID=UPI0028115FAD|nr:hypothetical protein [Pseudomonas otitidis]WMR30538.1 hypothetical protein QT513_15065 [Pseudomonas otitidis]